jgi:hypothetical protein
MLISSGWVGTIASSTPSHWSPTRFPTSRLLIDLDYMTRWVLGPDGWYTAWISPATLVFEDVYDLKGELGAVAGSSGFYTNGITRTPVPEPLAYDRWEIESELGLSFRASGFRQIIRREPMHVQAQSLTQAERGGLSFSEEPFDGAQPALDPRLPTGEGSRRERTEPLSAEELGALDREIAKLRLWRVAYDIHRHEQFGNPLSDPRAEDDDYLLSPGFSGLGLSQDRLVAEREVYLNNLRMRAKGNVIAHAGHQLGKLFQEINSLEAQRIRLRSRDDA